MHPHSIAITSHPVAVAQVVALAALVVLASVATGVDDYVGRTVDAIAAMGLAEVQATPFAGEAQEGAVERTAQR
jgi:hypothetical protein